jgi:hypothetical protein
MGVESLDAGGGAYVPFNPAVLSPERPAGVNRPLVRRSTEYLDGAIPGDIARTFGLGREGQAGGPPCRAAPLQAHYSAADCAKWISRADWALAELGHGPITTSWRPISLIRITN